MSYRSTIKASVFFIVVSAFIFSGQAFCQNDFERQLAKKVDSLLAPDNNEQQTQGLFPNDAAQTVTIPSGYGGYGTYLFGGLGGVYPQIYHTDADLIAFGGICTGDPVRAVNVAAGLNMTDVHRFRDFSANFNISRVVAAGTSISAGGLQLFTRKAQSDSPDATFYLVFSHAVQSLPSATEGCSKLTYTIGIGNGRFYSKSPADIAAGRGSNGTAIFGGLSYEIMKRFNLVGEWDGTNLGISAGLRPFKNLLSISVGAVNITRFSGDKPDLLLAVGYPLSLSRQNK
jgi:hypothetical protein